MKKEQDRQSPSTLFEGMTSISAVINGGHRSIEKVMFDKCLIDKKRRERAYIEKTANTHGFEIEFCQREDIDAVSTGTSHGGIVAQCGERTIPKLSEFKPGSGFYLMLEGIEDPYNFGYAIRSAYAAGVDAIILTPRNWMSAAGVVCRSSAGASELLPMYEAETNDNVCEHFKHGGCRVACAGIRNSQSAFDADLKKPLLLVVGGEKRGISSATLANADIIVRLDYGRDFRGSLSAASAASILSYEVLRQNR